MIWESIYGAVKGLGESVVDVVKEFHVDPDKALEMQHAIKLKVMEFQRGLWELEVKDKDSARKREVDLKDPTTRRLAYISMLGFFSVLAMQFYFAWTEHPISVGVQRTLDISTGVLFAMVLAVKDYYFGTSHSSSQKDITIDRVVNHRE